ncbi:MAG: NIPSNAP family protein [Bryobacterales bacterium]|nr:NIPSNAP family protein [Bryobacterales bacterium]
MLKLLCLSLMTVLALSLSTSATAQDGKVYELRTYTTMPGKLPELLARFKNHTTAIFEKHGMKNVGYWVPTDPKLSENTLIYILEHQSMEAAKKSWDGFRTDPAWLKARDESEVNGKLNQKVESVYMKATDFSKLR